MLLIVLVPVSVTQAATPAVVFETNFDGNGDFIVEWESLGWSRGDYAAGHDDDLWCRANSTWFGNLSRAVGYTISPHTEYTALYCAKLGNGPNGEKNIDNGYPDPGMDSWVRYTVSNPTRLEGLTLSFYYWAKTSDTASNYLCVNANNGTATTMVWKQPSADSGGWQLATVSLPAGTTWLEWEFKSSAAAGTKDYPGALIDDMSLNAANVLADPPASHIGSGISDYYSSRTVQVPVTWTNADRVSLYYRINGGGWTHYVDATHTDGLFSTSPITFIAPSDGQYQLFSLASNSTNTETMKTVAEASFTVDMVSPTVNITTPAQQSTHSTGMVTIGWNADDKGTWVIRAQVSMDNGTWADTTGESMAFTSLSEGSHTAWVQVFDAAGNSAKTSVTFSVNLHAPSMTFTPTGSDVKNDTAIVVSFTDPVDKGSISLTVKGVTGTLSWNGDNVTFTPSSTLSPETTYEATVSGKTAKGDSFNVSWSFTTISDHGSISGVIRDANGKAVANAVVKLSNGMTTTTDANGRFFFDKLGVGHFTITVSKDGYRVATMSVDVAASGTKDIGALSLESADGQSLDLVPIAAVLIVAVIGVGFVVYMVRRRK
ncbi:MAG: Ig-like domain-containing protein [Methanomassiliicoccus sp.]|nr:Ig-like domain-containing protein [Methanomassiliicoccus sp.]